MKLTVAVTMEKTLASRSVLTLVMILATRPSLDLTGNLRWRPTRASGFVRGSLTFLLRTGDAEIQETKAKTKTRREVTENFI